jgi:flagellar hook-associated protein 3 FlgL
MKIQSIGDLAQSLMLRQQNAGLKQTMQRLTSELSTGRVQDTSKHLSGDYSRLTDIERSMTLLNGYKTAGDEAAVFASATQSALERMQNVTSDLGTNLIQISSSTLSTVLETNSATALGQFESLVSALNTDVAGRGLFSGAATDRAAVLGADDLLADLKAAMAGATTAADMRTAADAYFGPSGGFETTGYVGSNTAIAPMALRDGEKVVLDIKADNSAFRDMLKETALAALATDPAFGLTRLDQAEVMNSAGQNLLTVQDDLTSLRAGVGFAESRIENFQTRTEAERISIEYAKGALLAVDPYEAATRLEDAQFQLESLYSVTVRLSRLNLTSFL